MRPDATGGRPFYPDFHPSMEVRFASALDGSIVRKPDSLRNCISGCSATMQTGDFRGSHGF